MLKMFISGNDLRANELKLGEGIYRLKKRKAFPNSSHNKVTHISSSKYFFMPPNIPKLSGGFFFVMRQMVQTSLIDDESI